LFQICCQLRDFWCVYSDWQR